MELSRKQRALNARHERLGGAQIRLRTAYSDELASAEERREIAEGDIRALLAEIRAISALADDATYDDVADAVDFPIEYRECVPDSRYFKG